MKQPMHQPGPRLSTLLLLAGLVLLVVTSFASLPLQWDAFFSVDAVQTSMEFLRGFVPPETSPAFLGKVAAATAETLSMSALGTGIAAFAGMVLALPASGRFGAG